MRIATILMAGIVPAVICASCTRHRVEVAPVEIKPIHITIDVNVKIDKALDDFFGDIDQKAEQIDVQSKD